MKTRRYLTAILVLLSIALIQAGKQVLADQKVVIRLNYVKVPLRGR